MRLAVLPLLLLVSCLLLLFDTENSRLSDLERFTSTPADFTKGIIIGYETKVSLVYSLRVSV